ncbi:MAG TPA: class I SAM-dependent methyltransferase [Geminicoccaceae bacterium]|nr:class I SAM-dependent methyltransferase [Geminicoccaceae bacterium]
MGLYRERVLPWLIHGAMRQEQLAPLRQRVVQGATGRVLEVGIGSGLNLPLYGRDVELVYGVDPSEALLEMARRRAGWMSFKVTLLVQSAEHLPLADRSFDTVVSSWALCSIPDVAAALAEIRRVLKPGGRLLFVEHGAAPEPAVRRWQDRLTPLWRPLAGGCHLNRPIDRLIAGAGLALADLETGYLVEGPRLLTYHYLGVALA